MPTSRSEGAAADRPRFRSESSELVWGGHGLTLLPGKAVWLAERRMLLVADVHIGKALSFRRAGLPVPHGTTDDMFMRLSGLLNEFAAEAIVFLGDLLHSRDAHASAAQDALRSWRRQYAGVGMTLVRGNHDDHAGDPAAELDIRCVDEPWILERPAASTSAADGRLALCHHPRAVSGCQVLAGHLHPAVRVAGGRAHDRLRLPCFHFRGDVGILPAFGSFTGMQVINRELGDRVFAVAEEAVLAL